MTKLRNIIAYVSRPFKWSNQRICGGGNNVQLTVSVEQRQEAEELLINKRRRNTNRELQNVSVKKPLSKMSSIYDLNPFIDEKDALELEEG